MAPININPTVVTPEPSGYNSELPSWSSTTGDAYMQRGNGFKQDPLGVLDSVLRVVTLCCSLIAFATVASISGNYTVPNGGIVVTISFVFSDFFYYSYLLTVNVLVFVYAMTTAGWVLVFLIKHWELPGYFLVVLFALDQIFSYLLISASTSAATGERLQNQILPFGHSFNTSSNAAITFGFLAFIALGLTALLSGWRLARRP